jgi:dihydropteroate synthase
VDRGDVILLGSRKQYAHLVQKLQSMAGWFGIQNIIEDIRQFLEDEELKTVLADGRVLTYEKMRIMGILNVTPDSFYAGSRVGAADALLQKAGTMLEQGADILDIGGESTRPGAEPVPVEEEIRRVTGALEQIKKHYPAAICSVDTYHAATAKAALACGADIINDVTAGTGDPAMVPVATEAGAPLVLMHMRGTPRTMAQPENKVYHNVIEDVAVYLLQRAQACKTAGLGKEKLILDPGIGFAKDVAQNLALAANLDALTHHGMPVLLAASRKGCIGKVLGGLPPEERLEGTLAFSAAAVYGGARLVRVHDIKENVRMIRMLEGILSWQQRMSD